ncbi:hypothetical protein SY83_09650 [Paenibacillus swuensis]|uniref:DUF3995 domain-containing protein n=1 Tax=Paenibacillus swuensis TaxID=1178515 RepID=A0A172THG5_9BACL|nr:DUF3995 domain-containing protein [Paenibacillus swuensis]ANE46498.1 hypothetical protein SY83_09650 [Paenibacillus swuensis]
MTALFVITAAVILIVISLIHFYWAFGGEWGGQAAIPQKVEGGAVFRPRMWETLVVAVGLIVFAFILTVQGGLLNFMEGSPLVHWTCLVCAFIFLIRAVGDFKYLGFFKKVKSSVFAGYDTWFFSPLCLYLALSFLLAWRSAG